MRHPGFAVTCCMSLIVGIYIGVNLSLVNSYHDPLNGHDAKSRHRQPGSEQGQLEALQVRVERSKREASQAMDHVLRLEIALQECQQRQLCPKETIFEKSSNTSSIRKNIESNNNNNMEHPICRLLPVPTPSASGLWHHYIMNVLQATRLPNDKKFKFHDFTAELLQIISPRLPRSVKTVPQEWKSLEYAMTIGWKRYQYLQEQQQLQQHNKQQQPPNPKISTYPPPRPLKVLVMGGSLLVGTNCRQVFSELQLGSQMGLPKRDCTWSNRLGKFLNMVFGVEFDSKTLHPIVDSTGYLFDVTKVAMGGTNTATGSVILEYDLIPENARNPDIIINAYATNDMHILTLLEAQSQNSTLRDKVFEMTQQFVRDVMDMSSSSSSSCNEGEEKGGQSPKPPPLLLHMDDYLGNEQRKIWETTELSQGAQVLANYYGFASLSYADVVRDFVYGDTYESWFSANWWGDNEKKTFAREIHPGMGMHIAATWVVAYNLLNLVTTYCSIPLLPEDPANISAYYDGAMGLPSLRHDVAQPKGKPKPRPLGLPPPLTQDLLIEDVTQLWRQDSLKRQSKATALLPTSTNSCDGKAATTTKCPFSWISGLSLQQNNKTWIDAYFRNRASTWQGWQLGDDGGKVGFVPTQPKNNSIVLDFVNVAQPIQSVTLFIMKSYGPKWDGSRLRLQTWLRNDNTDSNSNVINWEELNAKEVVGFHDKNTSEMYTEAIELTKPIERGTSLRVGAELVGGTMFKLMGLAVCS
jgi:hypothetical protein